MGRGFAVAADVPQRAGVGGMSEAAARDGGVERNAAEGAAGVGAAAKPRLSIVVNFHNMRREAARTLFTLSAAYQRGVEASSYEVIAVDNGSADPLSSAEVEAFGPNFRLRSLPPGSPSPCAAINGAVAASRGEFVMVCIDGARMLSPGLLRQAMTALSIYPHVFVYTLGMHLGHKPQNELIEEGYDQRAEDRLLAGLDWRADGYGLFSISSVAYSSRTGFLSDLSESNCFALRRGDFDALGGFDEGFRSPGGGLANLDFFNRASEAEHLRPIMLLGEATFHQFHHGVATNVPRSDHPWQAMAAEYVALRGRPFASVRRPAEYFGWLSREHHGHLLA
jgi:glycosyltransferase involved in cell wall biosynthesis